MFEPIRHFAGIFAVPSSQAAAERVVEVLTAVPILLTLPK